MTPLKRLESTRAHRWTKLRLNGPSLIGNDGATASEIASELTAMERKLLIVAAAFALGMVLLGIFLKPGEPEIVLEPSATNPDGTWFREEVLNSTTPVLVDFGAEWCGPCRMIAPLLDQLEKEYADKMKVVRIDVDEHSALAQDFGVSGIPLVVIIKEGKTVASMTGVPNNFSYADLVELVQPHL